LLTSRLSKGRRSEVATAVKGAATGLDNSGEVTRALLGLPSDCFEKRQHSVARHFVHR